jgi:putative Holliday junction resolvase
MILGLDWGQRKIGLAIAEPEIAIASAFDVIENNEHIFEELHKVIEQNNIDMIVIGKSAHLSQEDNTKLIESFGDTCCEELGLAVVFVPEMFSTREAHTNLKSAGKKNLDDKDDAEAARIILQQYLDIQ